MDLRHALGAGFVWALMPSWGCATYTAGALLTGADGRALPQAFRAGCIDAAVTPLGGLFPEIGPNAIALEIDAGNRCDEGVAIDLGALDVTVSYGCDEWLGASAYDPRREVHRARIYPRSAMRETLAYVPPRGGDVLQVCVAAGRAFNTTDASLRCFTRASPSDPWRMADE
jgi:hypothetical protein